VNIPNPTELGLKVFLLRSKHTADSCQIVAKDKRSAWQKFSTQYFAGLKPLRSDWTIQEVKER
jgi:hypothetical protein